MIPILTVVAVLATIIIFPRYTTVMSLAALPVVTAFVFTLGASPFDALGIAGLVVLLVARRKDMIEAFRITPRTPSYIPRKAEATK